MDIVQEVLKRQQEALSKFKPITVEKHLAVENDLGLLLTLDPNELDQNQMKFVTRKIFNVLNRLTASVLLSGPAKRSICLR